MSGNGDMAGALAATLDPAGLARFATGGRWVLARHLEELNRRITELVSDRGERLLVAMPPRHGKSELVSAYLPAWYSGSHPDRRVILASHEADFAASWGRRVRDILEEHGQALFGVTVRADSAAAHRWDIAGHRGGMITAGVGGTITGRGADLLIIDDPHKSAEEVQSLTHRERVWDWYRAVARTRLEPGANIVLIQTRWHEDDLAGRLLAEADTAGEKWEVLSLPALAEADDPLGRALGEPLWPERFDLDELAAVRRSMGSYWWAALYQQRPQPLGGGIFKRDWFRYYRTAGGAYRLLQPDGSATHVSAADCVRFCTVDLAVSTKTSADFTVVATWAETPNKDLLLLDRVRQRLEGPDQVPLLRRVYEQWSPSFIGIERVGYQLTLIQEANREGLPVRELTADRDKISRALVAAARMDAGTVYFPAGASWLGEFEDELLAFPSGRYDDQVDVLAYAAIQLVNRPEIAAWICDDDDAIQEAMTAPRRSALWGELSPKQYRAMQRTTGGGWL
ncbi:MAG: phage terminase large subunit [Acidobacteria bacterium]|nr:phage terminase large subunit [Acidobacteriota bacterium]